MHRITSRSTTTIRHVVAGAALALLVAPNFAQAQSAVIYGSLGNFDISNDTGKTCHGFQLDIDGLSAAQVPYSFTAQRYGAPQLVDYAGGVSVRWESPYDASTGRFVERTLPHTVPWFPGQCYQWTPGTYEDSGCEHFGAGALGNPTHVTARWLCEDSSHPGVLVPNDPPTAIPMPSYYVEPPVQAGDPPQVIMEVEAPEPAESPSLYGEAQWMRVFVRELPREVTLDELMADNPGVVPMDAGQLESDWDIIQDEPVAGGSGNRGRKRNGRALAPTTRSVIRRIEMYAFTGATDPLTNEALCADLTCTAPAADEVGELLSTQMTAVNVQADSVTVTKTGSGDVESSDRFLRCGNKCVSPYEAGTEVVLSAKAASGSVFAGWSGACSGTASTCTVTANGHVDVGAKFTATSGGSSGTTASMSVKVTSGKGVITSAPAGINCGKTCSKSVPSGTVMTLTATPEAGFRFAGWAGACTGTATTCSVTVTGAKSAQASFTK